MKTFCISFLLALSFVTQAQNDPLYNQYLFNQGVINPAYSGINKSFNATAISRVQWLGINGAPVTNTLHVSSSFLKDKLGGGLMVLNDKLGISSTSEVSLAINYKVLFLHSKLSFGMQGGLINFRYDYSKLNTEVVDQKITQAINNFSHRNIGAGIFYKADKFYIGISVPRMLDIKVQDAVSTSTRYRRHAYLSAGFIMDRFNAIKVKPSILIRHVDGVPPTLDLNLQVLFLETLWAGLTTRNFNTIGLISQIEISEKLRAGYLFEYPLSALSNTNFGTHELMVSLDLGLFKNQVAYRRYF